MSQPLPDEWTDQMKYFARNDAEVWSAGIFGPAYQKFGDKLLRFLDNEDEPVTVLEYLNFRNAALR